MATASADPQSGLFDKVVQSPEIEGLIDSMQENREAHKAFTKANKGLNDFIDESAIDLKPGARIRIGRYVVTTRSRAGGGFQVPAWEKSTAIGSIDLA